MLVTTAIADASLAPFEFAPAEARATFTTDRYHTADGTGRYTDDTQMSLAVCEHLLAGRPNTQAAWAESFMAAYRRDPRKGYSRRTAAALSSPDAVSMLAAVGAAGDRRGNGSVMRAAPLGMLPDPETVLSHCLVQSTATHASPAAAYAACMVALASHHLYHTGSAAELPSFLARATPGWVSVYTAWKDGTEVPCDARQTASYAVRMAKFTLDDNRPCEWLLRRAAEAGGDTDSAAAVSAALHWAARPLDDSLLGPLLNRLENGPYGWGTLAAVESAMQSRFPRNEQRQ